MLDICRIIYHQPPPCQHAPLQQAKRPMSVIRFLSLLSFILIVNFGQTDLDQALMVISEKISPLQKLETRLAKRYGFTGAIDSVEVFQETKTRALTRRDVQSVSALKALNTLYELRLDFATKQRALHYGVRRKWPLIGSVTAPHRIDASRFWAVVIGIDAYRFSPLRGCVSDTLFVEKYLTEHLGVPKERIQRLIGTQANIYPGDTSIPSRFNIIRTLLSVMTNPHIEYGDNIIIYYSGHGSHYSCSEYFYNWETGSDNGQADITGIGSIEALCPLDRNTLDANGTLVPDISDREINTILSQISRFKGRRITLILDCCHSGGMTRGLPEPGVRTVPPLTSLEDMLLIADEGLKGLPHYKSILAQDWRPDMDSHVVLAACREYEFAKEKRGKVGFNGVFTENLIQTLKSGHLGEGATYVDLAQALPRSRHQTPIVAGKNKYARLWFQD
ncbi:caspase domain-containing protein [Armillaria luteobubalina]|uniref:Caspase domain-containing protein n=1 Tax=Armillaria luteobubalina TaxID=153913 RepID=A0AA39QHR6_9AGAR|nr:caspase domain-containing protein [Armillaria luteobubalina]